MATSWSQETDENVNYTKLCRLLYDGGTLAVKMVFDGIVSPASLGATLATNKHKLQKLKKPTGKVLSQDQWNLLYSPSGGSSKSDDFDITLLFVLLRNICSLTPPPTGWDALPPTTDTSLEANLVRIKYYRNKVIAHSSKAEVGNIEFEAYWIDIGGALVSLGLKQDDIDELKLSPLGEKDYNNLVKYWYLSDEEIKHQLETIKTDISQITTDMSQITTDMSQITTYMSQITTDMSQITTDMSQMRTDTRKATSKIQSDVSQLKNLVESERTDTKSKFCAIESRMQNTKAQSELDRLHYVDYSSLVKTNCDKYHACTRQWILNQVEENVKQQTNGASVVLIRAGPGMGKSIVAAKICEIYKKDGLLSGCHFFQHSNSLRNNPRIMLQSIARQLCSSINGYQTALEAKLRTLQEKRISDLNCEELFGVLFEEPLSQIRMDRNVAIVIDALDECCSQFKNEFEDALERKLSSLPSWVRFVITTRPLPSCTNLSPAVQLEINASDPRNKEDLRRFFTYELTKRNSQHRINEVMKISKGLFLVAYFALVLVDQENNASPTEIKFLSHGISSIYKYYFSRIQNLIKPFIEVDGSFFQMLEAVAASERPIPKEMFYEILGLKSVDKVPRDKRKERNDAVHMLHTIFPVENDHVTVFHKSVADWLELNDDENPQFGVTVSSGIEVLTKISRDVLKAFMEREKPLNQPLVLSSREKYAFEFDHCHYPVISQEINSPNKEIDGLIAAAGLLWTAKENPSWFIKGIGGSSFLEGFLNFLRHDAEKLHFGHLLSLVGDLFLKGSQSSPLHQGLVLKKLPYYTLKVAATIPSFLKDDSVNDIFKVANGFICFLRTDDDNTILNIKDDGSFFEKKVLQPFFDIGGVSPDNEYLITIEGFVAEAIELRSITTFEIRKQFNNPAKLSNCMYIFGHDKEWYIVVQSNLERRLYVLNGLNGQLHSSITVSKDSDVIAVSPSGHILVRDHVLLHDTEKETNGESNISHDAIGCDEVDFLVDKILGCRYKKIGRSEFYISHLLNPDDKTYCCIADNHQLVFPYNDHELNCFFDDDGSKFSIDGNYVALLDYTSDTVLVFHTSNGTLYKRCDLDTGRFHNFIYVSSSCLIAGDLDNQYFAFYDLMANKLIYVMYCPFLPNLSQPVVIPPTNTDKFIPGLYALTSKELVKLEFHNLEENFLDTV